MLKMFKDPEIRKNIFTYTISGLLIVIGALIVLNIGGIADAIKGFLSVLAPFIWGVVFAFILSKFAVWFESILSDKLNFKVKRYLSTAASLILLILVLFLIALTIVPQLAESISSLSNTIVNFTSNAPQWIKNFRNNTTLPSNVAELIYEYSNTLISSIWTFLKTSIPNIVNFTIDTVSGVLNFVIGFIICIYILIDRENIIIKARRFFKAFLNEKQYVDLTVIYNVSVSRFYRFFEGKLLDSLIIGIICFVVMTILKLDYAILISFIVFVTNIIPFFGPFIGAIPSALILLMVDPKQCLIFVILIFVLQQIDGNIIGPRILGDSVGLSSLWIMFAIIVGGAYFGFFGMLLGVPVFSVIYFLVQRKIKSIEDKTN